MQIDLKGHMNLIHRQFVGSASGLVRDGNPERATLAYDASL